MKKVMAFPSTDRTVTVAIVSQSRVWVVLSETLSIVTRLCFVYNRIHEKTS